MKWKDAAIHDLRHLNSYKRSLENNRERLEMLDKTIKACRTSILNADPPSRGERTVEDAWCDAIMEKENILLEMDIKAAKISLIEKGLSALSPTQRKVLEGFYVSRKPDYVKTLCTELNIERATLYRIENSAIRQFTFEEYGIEF